MFAGGVVTLWQFHAFRHRVREVFVAEQRATAVMRVNNDVVILMSRLRRAAEKDDSQQFEIETKRLLGIFRSDSAEAAVALRQISPRTARQKLVIESLNDMLDSLPARVASLIELARADDWIALRAHLTNEVDHTDEVGEELMQETSDDLSQARSRLSQDMKLAERRAAQTFVFSSLLSLVVAGVLGLMVTRSITRPLASLDCAALAVAHGDFNHKVAVTGTDELARLANAFNRMTVELADLYARESEARETAEHLNETLQRANDDLSVFAYSASHDLQEPLRNVMLYTQMLLRKYKGQQDAESKEFFGYVVEGAERMSDLIRDLLAYMEVSNDDDDAAPVASTETAIEIALSNLRSAVLTNNATVVYAGLPTVAVQPVHLQEIFQNLISNAIKYRGDDPPEICISASEKDGYWQFSVRDNGIGIEPQYRSQIFKVFKRLHCRSKYPGTGIGLAICQKIVERYGGQIWIEPVVGNGSDFRFTLPSSVSRNAHNGHELTRRPKAL